MEWSDSIEALVVALRRRNLKRPTVEQYRQFIGAFAGRMRSLGMTDIRSVRREHVETYQGELLSRKLKPRTAAAHIQAVRQLYRFLCDSGALLCDPTDGVVALKYVRGLPRRHIRETEMRKLLVAPNVSTRIGIRDKAWLEVLYSTAIRVGELLALEVADADLELGLLRIREGKGRIGRLVPIGMAARRWLEEYVTRVRPWWMRSRPDERRLWVTASGRPLSIGSVQQRLRQLGAEAKLKGPIYPHAIRHAAATHMLARGADLRAVQKLLGHRHLASTVRYTHVTIDDVRATHRKTHPLGAEP